MAPKIGLVMEVPAMVYFPGQYINGSVRIESNKKIKCKNLSISFKGFAKVSWTESRTEQRSSSTNRQATTRQTTREYSAQEVYYEGQLQLWADPSQEMPSGVSQFPFTFVLPLNSPPSFVGRYGQVVHQMTIMLTSPSAFKNTNLVQPFSVNAVVDLNHNPNSREPQLQQGTHNLCCWCCKSGPLSLTVRLDKSGYAPGEPISINAELNNKTKSNISGTKAKFVMETTYKAVGKANLEQRTLAKISKGKIAKGAEGTWENEALLIPPLPPSTLPGCNIIDVCYQLQFIVSFQGASKDLMVLFPINLGSIPTVNSFPMASGALAPTAPPAYTPHGEALGWAPLPGLEQYPNIPPPTYQQATAGDAEGKATPYDVMERGTSQASTSEAAAAGFTPYYVSYNRRAAPSAPPQSASTHPDKSPMPK